MPHRFPVGLEVGHRREAQARVAIGVREGGDERRERRLARRARHGSSGGVDGIRTRCAGGQQRRQLTARRVVRMDVHREVEPLTQGCDQLGDRSRAQQARHVLDREDVRTGVDDLLGQAQVVVERVEVLSGIEQVARVAEGDLGH